jgi:hypothetical protein
VAVRLTLDAIALSATAFAVIVAMFQVEDGRLPQAVLWLAGALLVCTFVIEAVDLVSATA